MGHYDDYYEEQGRIDAADKNNQIKAEVSKIRIEIVKSLPLDTSFKGYYAELVDKLATCRVYQFEKNELNELLTEIVKHLHRL